MFWKPSAIRRFSTKLPLIIKGPLQNPILAISQLGYILKFQWFRNRINIEWWLFLISSHYEGPDSKSNFGQYFNCAINWTFTGFEIETHWKVFLYQKDFNLLSRVRFEIQFSAIFYCAIYWNLIDFEIEEKSRR